MRSFRNILQTDFFFCLLITFITSIVFRYLLLLPKFSIIGDIQRYNAYQTVIIQYSWIHYHQLGLWDQFLASGISWISNPAGPLFFITSWFLILFSHNIFFVGRMLLFIHVITAALAYYFLCRVIGLRKNTSFFISFLAFSTQYATTFILNGWFEEFFGLTLIPLSIAFLILALKKQNVFYAIGAAGIMAQHFFADTFYVFHYNVIIIFWIELWYSLLLIFTFYKAKKKEIKNLLRFIYINVIFWLVFVGLSAIKLLPILEFRAISARNVLPLSVIETPDGVMTFSFFKQVFKNFIIPAGHTNTLTMVTNTLCVTLILLAVVIFIKKRNIIYGMFLSLLGIGIWGYFANRIPIDLYALTYHYLPGFNSNNYPYRFMIIINFSFLICVALGLDVLLKQKNIFYRIGGYCVGLLITFGALYFVNSTFNNFVYPQVEDLQGMLSQPKTFSIKKNNYNIQPKVIGKIPDLLTTITYLVQTYSPEGRIYENSSDSEKLTTNPQLFIGQIPSVSYYYESIAPSYQYGLIFSGTTIDSLALTQKRYKIFSVLDTRFQLITGEKSEYKNCNSNENSLDEKCQFLLQRMKPIINNNQGTIYYDTAVLPKIAVIPYPILLISDNRYQDYSGFIAKSLLFDSNFNEHTFSILTKDKNFLDDYSLDELKQFSALFLVEPKIKNKKEVAQKLSSYEKQGGKVIWFTSTWREYEDIHDRSQSIMTDKPAWQYSKKDANDLQKLFKEISNQNLNKQNTKVRIQKFTPEDIIVRVTTSSNNQVLQLSDSFYPGWKATIDGKPTTVFMADGLVKGVIIPKSGSYVIHFYYDPDSLKEGAFISFITLCIILGIVWYERKR